MTAFVSGFALSLSLIAAIGAQNAFVLRQGILRQHVGSVVLTCILSEAILITAGVAGFGAVSEAVPGLAPAMRWGGAAFLVVYGALSLLRAVRGGAALTAADDGARSLRRTVATCLALTWLNPHVYLDTVVLLGAVAAGWDEGRWIFGAGALTASTVFFAVLGYGARALAPVFARPAAWRALDLGVAFLMWSIAAALIAH